MKAYLLPGSDEDLKSRNYQAVLDMYRQLGYQPHFVSINWKYKTMDDWVAEVESKISKEDIQNSLLSGFSLGSMVALAVAAKANPKQLLLFSLSPYFAEDLPDMEEKYKRYTGLRRLKNFEEISFNKLAAKIKCPTKIFIGQKEVDKFSDMKIRSNEAKSKIRDSRLIVIEGVGHDVANPIYISAIKEKLHSK